MRPTGGSGQRAPRYTTSLLFCCLLPCSDCSSHAVSQAWASFSIFSLALCGAAPAVVPQGCFSQVSSLEKSPRFPIKQPCSLCHSCRITLLLPSQHVSPSATIFLFVVLLICCGHTVSSLGVEIGLFTVHPWCPEQGMAYCWCIINIVEIISV